MTDTAYPGNYSASSGTITIAGGDRLILSGTASLGPNVLFTGGGTLLTSGTATITQITADGGLTLDNTGTVTETGTLTLASATLRIESGGVYNIAGDVGIGAGSSGAPVIYNSGTLAKTSGSGISHIAVTTVSTGTLSVADGNLRFDSVGNSFSGTYIGSGMIDYGVGSVSTLYTINMVNAACSTNFGTVNQAGTITLGSWSTIKNLVGSTWNFTSDAGLVLAPGSNPPPTFTNKGYFTKSGGTHTTAIGIDVSNEDSAVVSVTTGTLSFNGASNMFSGYLTGAGTVAFGGGGSTALGAGTTADVAKLLVAGAGTSLTVGTAFTYSGSFSIGTGATVNIGAGDTLALSNAAALGGTVVLTGSGASRAALSIQGIVSGYGTVALNGSASVEFGSKAPGQTVSFAGTGNVLKLDVPASFGGSIVGFNSGDTIDFAGQSVKALRYDGALLTATLSTGKIQTLKLSGSVSGVAATSDGSGGTNIAAIAGPYTATSGSDAVAFVSGANTVNATAATIGASDSFVGGTGFDTLALSGGGSIVLGKTVNFSGFERIQLAAGGNYVLVTGDKNVASAQSLSVDASALASTNSLTFNGATETDGTFSVTSGAGNDRLTSGRGADAMAGGAGDDCYWVNNVNDIVSEAAGAGYDRVFASTSYALGAGQSIEKLSAADTSATAAINLSGNGLAQAIIGNAGNNILDGNGGKDVLVGGGGNDTFVFDSTLDATNNVAHITDFTVGADMIELSHAIFQALAPGALDPTAFHAGTTAASASDRIIYNPTNGALFYDTNGNAAGGSTQFATLSPGLSLSASDFKIV